MKGLVRDMAGFFKKFAAVFLAAGLFVIGAAGFYSVTLPDCYNVDGGEKLMINSLFSISARPCDSNVTVAVTQDTSGSKKITENRLMLFGAVPIKDVSAYSSDRPMLVPCGNTFGIKLITDGVMVVGLQENSNKCAAKACGIKEGDIILSINGEDVTSNDDVAKIISQCSGNACGVKILRDGNELDVRLVPDSINGEYKAGMWVRDSSAGIGTMTFYDPQTSCFGGLGHPICDADVKKPLPLSEGKTGDVNLSGFTKSQDGSPGYLSGDFANTAGTGTIYDNCKCGVFGVLNSPPDTDHEEIPLGFRQEIKEGKATIYTSTDNSGPKEYEIKISKINMSENADHDFEVEITDKELINLTGGILQGMSGSPIIQDGKLVGAVTHVLIDNPKCGYGVFADEMYRQSSETFEKSLENAG